MPLVDPWATSLLPVPGKSGFGGWIVKLAMGRLSPRSIFLPLLLGIIITAFSPPTVLADEQRVDRFGLALFVGATTLNPKYVNEQIRAINEVITRPPDSLKPIDEIKASPLFQLEGRFFVSDKIVAVLGVGYMERTEQLSLMRSGGEEILVQGHVQGVPIYAGVNYYFLPYTSGDVTWRPFAGGGFMSMVEGRAKVGFAVEAADSSSDMFDRAMGEGAGFYLEAGVHLMLPGSWSFLGNIYYRHLTLPSVWALTAKGEPIEGGPVLDNDGQVVDVDLSGFGLRVGIQFDLFDRF
jgi:hypothetical protein